MSWANRKHDSDDRGAFWRRSCLIVAAVACCGGCETPSAHTFSRNYSLREELATDPPREPGQAEDDRLNGGRLFALYCGSCHNARPLGERPFSNYHVALTHMRQQAYLTGKEYRQIMFFLRRWNDLGEPTPPVEPPPKRFFFSQPIAELKGENTAGAPGAPPPPPGAGAFRQPAPAGAQRGLPAAPQDMPAPIE
jgi:hypothetical protein